MKTGWRASCWLSPIQLTRHPLCGSRIENALPNIKRELRTGLAVNLVNYGSAVARPALLVQVPQSARAVAGDDEMTTALQHTIKER